MLTTYLQTRVNLASVGWRHLTAWLTWIFLNGDPLQANLNRSGKDCIAVFYTADA